MLSTGKPAIIMGTVTALALSLFSRVSWAQLPATVTVAGSNLGTGGIAPAIFQVINFILGLAGVVALLVVVIAGFMYIVSFGEERRAETAKRMVLYAIIGLIVIGVSLIIVNLVLGIV